MRLLLRSGIILMLSTMLVATSTTSATATTDTADFRYAGSVTDSVNLGGFFIEISGCVFGGNPVTCFPDVFPGTLDMTVTFSVDSEAALKAAGHFTLVFPDTVRQGRNMALSAQLVAFDDVGKEALLDSTVNIHLDVAYDRPFADGTFDDFFSDTFPVGPVTLVDKDIVAPYAGNSASTSQTAASPRLDVGQIIGSLFGVPGLSGLVKVGLDLDTDLSLTAPNPGGYQATRILKADGTVLDSDPITFPGPDPIDETIPVPCSAAVGEDLKYKLKDQAWNGAAEASSTLKGVVEIVDPIPDVEVNLLSAPILAENASLPATDFKVNLGEIQAEKKPPKIMAISESGTFVEGSDTDFTAVATDNCSGAAELTYRWFFSDGGVGFGPTTHHVFADDGHYTGTVVVTDAAGNSASQDFVVNDPVGITNGNPIPSSVPNATAVWGVPVQFHADAYDPGPADQPTLHFAWDFGDGSAALGQDVLHTYSAPGSFGVTLTVHDKDGGVGTTTQTTTIAARGTSLAYTGDNHGLPNSHVTLSASLSDELGNPVIGRMVNFTLGAQTISARTNILGVASIALKLTQTVGNYTVTASFTGDTHHLGNSDAVSFRIGS
ncbi:MAG: PKD domain-containing protein [Actinomycetota bacterium]